MVNNLVVSNKSEIKSEYGNGLNLEDRIVSLVNASKIKIAISVNSGITELYWNIGHLINEDVLKNKRADYGNYVVKKISETLTLKFGKGWSPKQIHRFMQFAKEFSREKVATLWRQLTWSHIKQLLPMENDLKRDFYIEMCRLDKSNIRVADYLTVLPSKEILQEKLQLSIERAKNRAREITEKD